MGQTRARLSQAVNYEGAPELHGQNGIHWRWAKVTRISALEHRFENLKFLSDKILKTMTSEKMEVEISNPIPERTEKRPSDEGYSSDLSPSKIIESEEKSKNLKALIKQETEEFKTKYFVRKILYNSANGVIYEGNFSSQYEITYKKSKYTDFISDPWQS